MWSIGSPVTTRWCSPDVIAEVVDELHATFNGAPVRDYVPLFVERKARTALEELSVSYA